MEHTAQGMRSDTPSRYNTTQAQLPNIVRDIRTNANMTQRELAIKTGLSNLAILRSEQYLYVELINPLPQALSELDSAGRTPEAISTSYSKGRTMQLHVNSEMITSNPYYRTRIRAALNYAMDHGLIKEQANVSPDDNRFSHPFCLFRTYLFAQFDLPVSQIKFCQFTGIHPTVLSRLESYETTMEDSVIAGLSFILQMQDNEINTLKLMCDQAL